MRSSPTNRLPGIIDTLSAGFEAINRRPWLILLPVLVDLLLWRGPFITPLPLLQGLVDASLAAGSPAELGAEGAARLEEMRAEATATIAGFNMLTLVVLNFVASVPSASGVFGAEWFGHFLVDDWPAFLLLFAGLEALGLLLGSLYFGLIAQQVRDGQVDFARLVKNLGFFFLSITVFALVVLAAIVGLGLPVSVLAAVGILLGGGVASGLLGIGLMAIYIAGMWAVLFLYFVVDAIVVSEVPTRRAILSSVLIVRRYFRSALGFIVLVFVISAGMQVIWSNLAGSVWGTVAAIFGNAYIASGLAAASMTFYMSRLARLEQHGNDKRNV